MNKKYVGLICGVLGLLLFLIPDKRNTPKPDPQPPAPAVDNVSKAFDTYEKLWRKHASDAADKIVAGELDSQQKVWEFIAAGQEPARRLAFEEIAKSEQDFFTQKGGWSPELHVELLRSYTK